MNTKESITRAYDRTAAAYAAQLADELDRKPFDRLFLRWFAERLPPGEPVLEIGSGPGEVAACLQSCGLDCLATDISPEMVAVGKATFPQVRFEVQDFFALTCPDAAFGGVVAFYAIVNLTLPEVRDVLAEARRVLKPGGLLLLAFHTAETVESLTVADFFGETDNPLTFYYFPTDAIKALLEETGYEVLELLVRYPYKDAEYPSQRAYCMARWDRD
ncbi:MAG: class I SAM-dependent methyltransferase [Anaerolineae bacterium]|nr:class I SAM-dependent methyltransferase [Anaerolineae bacterium]